jgi:hypothetical protein
MRDEEVRASVDNAMSAHLVGVGSGELGRTMPPGARHCWRPTATHWPPEAVQCRTGVDGDSTPLINFANDAYCR